MESMEFQDVESMSWSHLGPKRIDQEIIPKIEDMTEKSFHYWAETLGPSNQ